MDEGTPGREHADRFSRRLFSARSGGGEGVNFEGGEIIVSEVVNKFWELGKCEV